MYKTIFTSQFKKNLKKLNKKDLELVYKVIDLLAIDTPLDISYCDHKLQGRLKDYRECHIKPNLLLIYKKEKAKLILTCFNIGSHSAILGI